MRSYLIDEISFSDLGKIEEFLRLKAIQSGLGKIFWVPLPPHILSPKQVQHPQCQPHVFAAELGPDWFKIEFLVRSMNGVGCECQGYCTREQEQFILRWAQDLVRHLRIET
jgi:hypothetical protein